MLLGFESHLQYSLHTDRREYTVMFILMSTKSTHSLRTFLITAHLSLSFNLTFRHFYFFSTVSSMLSADDSSECGHKHGWQIEMTIGITEACLHGMQLGQCGNVLSSEIDLPEISECQQNINSLPVRFNPLPCTTQQAEMPSPPEYFTWHSIKALVNQQTLFLVTQSYMFPY